MPTFKSLLSEALSPFIHNVTMTGPLSFDASVGSLLKIPCPSLVRVKYQGPGDQTLSRQDQQDRKAVKNVGSETG